MCAGGCRWETGCSLLVTSLVSASRGELERESERVRARERERERVKGLTL